MKLIWTDEIRFNRFGVCKLMKNMKKIIISSGFNSVS